MSGGKGYLRESRNRVDWVVIYGDQEKKLSVIRRRGAGRGRVGHATGIDAVPGAYPWETTLSQNHNARRDEESPPKGNS